MSLLPFKRPTDEPPARDGLMQVIRAGASVVAAALSPARPDRARLKAAIAARDAAQQSVIEARETLGRLQAIVDQADDVAREATHAKRKASEFRKQWARSGTYSETLELKALEDVAAEKARAAERATQDGDAVRGELSRAQDEIRWRQSEIEGREDEIAAAINEIQVAEERGYCDDYEADAQRLRDKRARLMCFEEFVKTEKYSERHAPHQRIVRDVLARGQILPFDKEREDPLAADRLYGTRHEQEWREAYMRHWRERAAQLRANPES
jgi:hypothetical protein